MTHHSDLINHLIQLRGLKSYLEIGTFNREHNFNLINAEEKHCVDPDPTAKADYIMTSDDFFKDWSFFRKWDLIFIDGLHHADQVRKDFENALKVLNDKGFIVLHDCNPHSEKITHVPRDNGEWCGDVYKFACTLSEYSGINFVTIDFDYGCAVVWKEHSYPETVGAITWERFEKEKQKLLRLVDRKLLHLYIK